MAKGYAKCKTKREREREREREAQVNLYYSKWKELQLKVTKSVYILTYGNCP